jgi:hypothetical protein
MKGFHMPAYLLFLREPAPFNKGHIHKRQAHGIGVGSSSEIQRNPLVFTKNSVLERTESRETFRAALV